MAAYEQQAVLALPPGEVARGAEAIRTANTQLLATEHAFAAGKQSPALVNDDLALTSPAYPVEPRPKWHGDSTMAAGCG